MTEVACDYSPPSLREAPSLKREGAPKRGVSGLLLALALLVPGLGLAQSFTKITTGPVVSDGGDSRGSCWGDYDNDGDLDLFVANWNQNNFLYVNNGDGSHWINLQLVGTQSNVWAIGAKVRLKATIAGSPLWQLDEISGQTGYASQNSLNAEFGLGDATIIDSIRIEWPSGIVWDTTNVAGDQFLTITEPVQIPTTSLVAYYPFNGNANDESGNGNDGTVYGATLTADRFGRANSAYNFDGAYDYIVVQDDSSLDLAITELSITAWIEPRTTSNEYIVKKGTAYTLDIYPGRVRSVMRNQTLGQGSATGITPIKAGEWQFLAVTRENDTIRVYYNGEIEGNAKLPGLLENVSHTLDIGTYSEVSLYYDGKIDDIRIYNRDLTEAEIQALYHEGGWALEDTTAPAAPTGLTATPGPSADGQITLTWSPNSEPDLAKYRIYRGTTSPASTLIDSVVGSRPDTFYTDTGLSNGQTYYYRIKAVDSAGNESGFSTEAKATTYYPISGSLTTVSSPTTETLEGVFFNNSLNGWAVGGTGNIIHYDGISWTIHSQPVTQPIHDVHFASSSDGWAVTEYGYILHYDGSTWDVDADLAINFLSSVYFNNPSDGWAVGHLGRIFHYNGSSWSEVTKPSSDNLSAVYFVNSSDGWAVGNNGRIIHYNGSAWSTISSLTTQHLDGLYFASASDGWAVGNSGTILHYNGTEWSIIESPTTKTLSCISDGWIAGDDGTILYHDGAVWSYVNSPSSDHLYGVHFITSNEGWIVGYNGTIIMYLFDAPPAAPTGLTTTPIYQGITLSWSLGSESDLSHYVVYQSTTAGFTPASDDSVGTVLKPNTTFTAAGLTEGVTYYYRVAAVDSSGSYSPASTEVSAQPSSTLFTAIGAGLTGVEYSSAAWGDYDNDGDLDILLTGRSSYGYISRIYRNDGGSFTAIGAGLTGVSISSAAWGDYDNDGDLDILLTGLASSGRISRVYRNDTGSFTAIGAGLTGVYWSSAAWGDYDNDGDLDILLTGYSSSGEISKVYCNDGGSFTAIDAGLTGVYWSSAAWGDYDNDGDLDILLTGYTGSISISKVYRNDLPIIDYPPQVAWTVSDTLFYIGTYATLTWSASDNVGVVANDLTYRIGMTGNWTSIAGELTDTSYTWHIPNSPTDSLMLRVIARDAAGLTDTAYTDWLTVVPVYPTLVWPASSPVGMGWQARSLVLGFNVALDSALDVGQAISVGAPRISGAARKVVYLPKDDRIIVEFQAPLASLDTFSVDILADYLRSYYGYGFDGDRDGTAEGSPTDNINLTYVVYPYGDFDSTWCVDFTDVSRLTTVWYARDYAWELGPATGQVPHLLVSPDGRFDVRDLMTFIRMWEWSSQSGCAQLLAKVIEGDQQIPLELVADAGELILTLPDLQDLAALFVQYTYPPERVDLSLSDSVSMPNVLRLHRQWLHQGIAEVNMALLSRKSTIGNLSAGVRAKSRDAVDITVYVLAVDSLGQRLGEGMATISVNPVPMRYALHHNYPNPFNPTTTIMYDIPKETRVTLVIYNLLGQEVQTIRKGLIEPGYYRFIWNGRDASGKQLSSGLYFARLVTPEFAKTIKMLLLK